MIATKNHIRTKVSFWQLPELYTHYHMSVNSLLHPFTGATNLVSETFGTPRYIALSYFISTGILQNFPQHQNEDSVFDSYNATPLNGAY